MSPPTNYDSLTTEQRDTTLPPLDLMSPIQLVRAINRHDQQAIRAVGRASADLAALVKQTAECLAAGGRLIYIGTGTSGRLGFLDAAECPPTFSTAPNRVIAIIAGGRRSLAQSSEGAEDSATDGAAKLSAIKPKPDDMVCGISASGVTPFVWGALKRAKKYGCHTALITCGQIDTCHEVFVDLPVRLDVGAEILSGSTRMKAGLATKAVLHTLSTATMVGLGKVHDNLMVDVRPTNKKLRQRALRIVKTLAQVSSARASQLLKAAGDRCKVAIVIHCQQVSAREAEKLLAECDGRLRGLLREPDGYARIAPLRQNGPRRREISRKGIDRV